MNQHVTPPARLSDAVRDRFVAIVGMAHAVTHDADIAPYLMERRNAWHGASQLVIKPGSTAEVSSILRLASETGTPVVPQGGNTGLVGGQTPDASGAAIVLSTERLNRIREIDTSGNTMTVEAGVILQDIQAAAEAAGRLFPLSLASQGSCRIGGNLSSNAGGVHVLAYGNARELCLGVEVVLPTGEILDDLRKLKKDNTGYDLKNLFVGAEGTLGVITAAVLKLFPQPRGRAVAFAAFASPEAALDLFERATDAAGSQLTAFELLPDICIDFVTRHVPEVRAPFPVRHPWNALIEVSSGRSQDDARQIMESILADGFDAGSVLDAVLAGSLAQEAAFWNLRETMPETQRREGYSIKHDISVPVAAIPAFISEASRAVLAIEPQARILAFGHMGDGNLHYNISRPEAGEDAAFKALAPAITHAVHAIVRAMDGSISAEHGIGQLKRDELLATAPPVAIDLMRRIKAAFDPAGIMNPGKVI